MICDQCETVVHCAKNGCIPKQPLQGKTVIDMAREAGKHQWPLEPDFLKRFADLVRAAERDACAQVCGKIAEGDSSDPNNEVAEYTIYGIAMECANAIRARGEDE
jgi:hypothetical protein